MWTHWWLVVNEFQEWELGSGFRNEFDNSGSTLEPGTQLFSQWNCLTNMQENGF